MTFHFASSFVRAALGAALVAILPAACLAQVGGSDRAGASVTLGLSTMGAMVEPGYRFGNRFGVRAPIAYASGSFDYDSDDEAYEADATIGGIGIVGDLYPFGGAFRLSAGVVRPTYDFDLMSRGFEIDGVTGDLSVAVEQSNNIAPMAGLGYDIPVLRRGLIRLDAGAIFAGGFDVTAEDASNRLSQAAIDAEIADIRDDFAGVDAIPFLRVSVGLRF